MNGRVIFSRAVRNLSDACVRALEKIDLAIDDVDLVIPHQANLRIIEATVKRLKMSMERVILTVQDHGSTSAASVPMALDVAVRDGRIQRGHLVLLEAFGGGLTSGSALLRY